MTEKKAPFGNNFTPEQRSAALKRAADMRAARAEYLGRVKSGGGPSCLISRVFGCAWGASRSGNMDGCGGGRDWARIASRADIPVAPEGAR